MPCLARVLELQVKQKNAMRFAWCGGGPNMMGWEKVKHQAGRKKGTHVGVPGNVN